MTTKAPKAKVIVKKITTKQAASKMASAISATLKSKTSKKVVTKKAVTVKASTKTIKLNALNRVQKSLVKIVDTISSRTSSPSRLQKISEIKNQLKSATKDFFATRFGSMVLEFLTVNEIKPLTTEGVKQLENFCTHKLLHFGACSKEAQNLLQEQIIINDAVQGAPSQGVEARVKATTKACLQQFDKLCVLSRKAS